MSISRTININASIGGLSITGSLVRVGNNEVNADSTIPAGVAGKLTVMTDPDTGSITATNPSHGITTGMKVDVYWVGGLKRGMTVGTVAGAVIPIDLGTGDPLPAATTDVVVSPQVTLDVDFTGAGVILAAARATKRCSAQFQQTAGTLILALDLGKSGNNNEVWEWASKGPTPNLFTADVGKVVVSNGASDGTCNFRFGALLGTP